MTAKMTANWSFAENGNPFLDSYASFAGDNGKHDLPGNKGYLSKNVGAFSFIIPKSSANIQPTAHISIAGP